jgi:hypothetical protein
VGCTSNAGESGDSGAGSQSASADGGAPEQDPGASVVTAEARVAALKDMRGNNLQIPPAETTRTGYETAAAAMKDVLVQPAECKVIAVQNMGSVNQFEGEGVIGAGAADQQGSVLSAGLLDGATVTSPVEEFAGTRERFQRCASFTVSGSTLTTIDELPQDPIADESYAVLITQQLGPDFFQYTLSVNARSDELIASVQSVGNTKPDGILQDKLADLTAQLLETPTS